MAKLLKIYKLPERWVALYENEKFSSWQIKFYPNVEEAKEAAESLLGGPSPIRDYVKEDFGQQAQECWNGKHEDCCVWRAEDKETNTDSAECTCNLWLGCTCEAGRAELKKERLSSG